MPVLEKKIQVNLWRETELKNAFIIDAIDNLLSMLSKAESFRSLKGSNEIRNETLSPRLRTTFKLVGGTSTRWGQNISSEDIPSPRFSGFDQWVA